MVSNWRQIEKNDASSSSLAEEAAKHLPGWRRKGNKGQIWLKKKIQSEKTFTPIHEKLTTISENWKQSAFRLSVIKPNLNSHNSQ